MVNWENLDWAKVKFEGASLLISGTFCLTTTFGLFKFELNRTIRSEMVKGTLPVLPDLNLFIYNRLLKNSLTGKNPSLWLPIFSTLALQTSKFCFCNSVKYR